MQKKLIALAVAAALTTPALAMADVTVYGKAFLDVENVSNDKNTAPTVANGKSSAMRVATNASRLGVKGSEDLGDNLKAIFQYEVQMDANGVGANGLGNGTRNSGVGMEGDFGKVIIGRWDSPYKVVHNKVELFDNASVFSATNVVGRTAGGKNYNNRQSSMIQYWTPKMSGFQAALMIAPDAAPTAAVGAVAGTNKQIIALSGAFDQDGIYAGLGYESRADQTVAGTTDSALRLTGKYDLGTAWIGATVESIKTNTALNASYTQNIMELAGQYNFDANFIGLSYAKAGKTNVANTGATQVSLKLGHNFSKKVEGFLAYTNLKNDAVTVAGTGGTYGFSAGTTYGPALGSTQSAFGAGMVMSF